MAHGYDIDCTCNSCMKQTRRYISNGSPRQQTPRSLRRGTRHSTAFRDSPQRSDPSVVNTYFNAGQQDGGAHGHVKYRDNPDGTTDYLYARDVEGNEYDV